MSNHESFDILVSGDLCAFDLILAEYLARKGLNLRVVRIVSSSIGRETMTLPSGFFKAFDPSRIVEVAKPAELISLIKRTKLIVTFTGSIGFALRWHWPVRGLRSFPPIFNIATGADFMELLDEHSITGAYYRYFVRTCDLNLIPPYPMILQNIIKYKLHNILFFRFPFLLPQFGGESGTLRGGGRLRIFHPSHLDFKVNDPGERRKSSKGNDRFIRALLRAFADGLDAECVILDRGPDRQVVREMVQTSRFADRFIWKPHLSRDDLVAEFEAADVIVDQFDVGGLGAIAIEAMAMERPVMIYLQEQCLDLLYPEHPPVLNARTEEEIYRQLMHLPDRAGLRNLGRQARKWVQRYHSWDSCLAPLLFYYTLFTGHQVADFGWETTR